MRGRQLNMHWRGILPLDFSVSLQCLCVSFLRRKCSNWLTYTVLLHRLLLSLLTPLNTWAIILGTPTPGTGSSSILTDGPATLTWTLEAGDPKLVTFEIHNNVTLDSFEFAAQVQASDMSITRNMTDVIAR